MNDIVERLRKVEPNGTDSEYATNWYRNPDGPEAADEIERLRAKLAEAKNWAQHRHDCARHPDQEYYFSRYEWTKEKCDCGLDAFLKDSSK
jgi:hypothetical protein